jgi:Peptidase family M23.
MQVSIKKSCLPYTAYLLSVLVFLPFGLLGQKKDTLRLACLLDHAIEAPQEKPTANSGPVELKIVLSSPTDTLVKACTDARVSSVQKSDDGKWEVVFFQKDYWFWLSGLTKAYVTKNQKIKTGQALGYLEPGDQVELLLYDFETPIDPRKYMNCRQ